MRVHSCIEGDIEEFCPSLNWHCTSERVSIADELNTTLWHVCGLVTPLCTSGW